VFLVGAVAGTVRPIRGWRRDPTPTATWLKRWLTGRLGAGARRQPPAAEVRPESDESDTTSVAFAAACGLILFVLLSRAGYAALHDSLYAAGQKATARDAQKDEGEADAKTA
jgi:hypothetical protein